MLKMLKKKIIVQLYNWYEHFELIAFFDLFQILQFFFYYRLDTNKLLITCYCEKM